MNDTAYTAPSVKLDGVQDVFARSMIAFYIIFKFKNEENNISHEEQTKLLTTDKYFQIPLATMQAFDDMNYHDDMFSDINKTMEIFKKAYVYWRNEEPEKIIVAVMAMDAILDYLGEDINEEEKGILFRRPDLRRFALLPLIARRVANRVDIFKIPDAQFDDVFNLTASEIAKELQAKANKEAQSNEG